MQSDKMAKAKLYTRYPLFSLFIYNGSTVLHFLMGGIGIALGYHLSSWAGYGAGSLYLVFSFVEMYVLMPLTVCPNCVYHKTQDSLCISGLNTLLKKNAKPGDLKDFPKRARGLFCNNHLYLVALLTPIIVMIPALILNFSFLLLVIFFVLVGLLLFRFFAIFPKIACIHCSAKFKCPQAEAIGVRNL